MRRILFEGMDNCGKDTQIKLLKPFLYDMPVQELKYSSFPKFNKEQCLSYSKEVYNQLMDWILDNEVINCNLICNRAHLGEYVYGQLYRNYTKEEATKQISIDNKLKDCEDVFLIVLVDSNYENLAKREDGLSQSKAKKELLEKEYNLFKEAYELSNIKNKLIIDISSNDIDFVHEKIKKFIFEIKE